MKRMLDFNLEKDKIVKRPRLEENIENGISIF
jgi:hypothetical protein